jgi:hypothetical protein
LVPLWAFAQYGPAGTPAVTSAIPFQPLAKTSAIAATTTSANIALVATATPTSVTITGTAGQFACSTCSTLYVGMQLTISGTFGGTGSITGYTNPSTYLVSAVGSGTFTLSNSPTNGWTPLVTTAGTPTGLTYTANVAVSSHQVQVYNSAANTAFVIFCATSSCTAAVGSTGTSTSDYPIAPGAVIVLTVPTGTNYAAAILSSSTGTVYMTPGTGQ